MFSCVFRKFCLILYINRNNQTLTHILTQTNYTMGTNYYFTYLAPEFEVVAVEVEQGYFQSNLEDPEENPEQGW